MNSTYRIAVKAAFLLVACGGVVPAARAADDAPLSFQFSETLHVRDQKTVVDQVNGSLTEHFSSEGGTVRLDASVPLDGDLTLDTSTPIVVTAGSLTLRSTLGTDTHYRVGMHQANIALTVPAASGKSSVVYGHVKVKWTKSRLTVQVEGNIPQLVPVCARDFVSKTSRAAVVKTQPVKLIDEIGGEVNGTGVALVSADADKGETRAELEVGPIKASARVRFQVKESSKAKNGGPYVESGVDWKYIKASPGEMAAGQHSSSETTIKVTGSDGA